VVLPTLPDIALKVRDAVSNGNASAKELAEMIAADASLSTRLIYVANSPLYRGATGINTIQLN
jgi:HD-like signal output (HDOD) protein